MFSFANFRTPALHILCALVVLTGVLGSSAATSPPVFAADDAPGTLKPLNLQEASMKEGKAAEFGCPSEIMGCLAYASYWVMMGFAWIAGIAGYLLNFAVMETVVGMGQLVGELPAINVAWVALRDIANVFLLFLTIFIGIATILGISGYTYKQLLWRVLLAAIFVNFSIFFTKVIIDVSNLSATELYKILLTEAVTPATAETCTKAIAVTDFANSECLKDGIAGAFTNQLKIITIMNNRSALVGSGTDMHAKTIFVGIMASLLFVVMTFIFGAAALLLVGRFIILVILIVLSPIAFVLWITKVGGGGGSRWWSKLLNQAFFAPALFLMFWVSFKIIQGMAARFVGWDAAVSSFYQASQGNLSSMSIMLFFVLAAGFLIGSLMIAKWMGALGADAAMKTGKSWSKAAGGFAFAYSAGSLSRGLAVGYNRLQARAQETNEDGSYKRRGASRALRLMSGSALDRGIAGGLGYAANRGIMGAKSINDRFDASRKANEARRAVINQTGADRKLTGALERVGRQLGTKAELEEDIRTIRSANPADLQRIGSDRFIGVGMTYTDNPHIQKALSGSQADAFLKNSANLAGEKSALAATRSAELRTAVERWKAPPPAPSASATEAEKDAYQKERIEDERRVREASVDEIKASRDFFSAHPEAARLWSEEKHEQIQKTDGVFSTQEKNAFRNHHYSELRTALAGTINEKGEKIYTPAQRTIIDRASQKALYDNRDLFMQHKEVANFLGADKFSKIMDSPEYTAQQKKDLLENRFKEVKRVVASNDVSAIKKITKQLSQKELEMLDEATLTTPAFLASLKSDTFKDLTSNKQTKISPITVETMRANRAAYFETLAKTPEAAALFLDDLTTDEIAKLDSSFLANETVYQHFDRDTLLKVLSLLSRGQKEEIRTHFLGRYAGLKSRMAKDPSLTFDKLERTDRRIYEIGTMYENPGPIRGNFT